MTCPQCPDASDLAAKYLLVDTCTGAKLHVELGKLTGVDAGEFEQAFSEGCQGVTLLGGSVLSGACSAAGGVMIGMNLIPGREPEAMQAAALVERYCTP